MVYEWKDYVVLITGAATGIGAEVVKQILEENVKHVAVLDIDESTGLMQQNELNSKHGAGKVKFYKCDVTDEKVLFDVFRSVMDEQGYIDVVINNAGIMNDSPQMYKKEIDINVTALVTGTLKAMKIMRKDKGGRGGTVINIASIVGLLQQPALPVYTATKSAVIQFSNCIGLDEYYSKTGVRVLVICFGCTSTALLTPQKFATIDPDFTGLVTKSLETAILQRPESAAKGVVDAFKQGSSGSTWLVDVDKPALDISSDVQQAYTVMSSKVDISW